MLQKYVIPGNRVEIQPIGHVKLTGETKKKKAYQSTVYDVISEDRLEIYMPIEKLKLILLPVDEEFDLCFYTTNGLYQCFARIIDRYKTDNKYLLLLELTSNLRRFQRRDYYRLSCALEMNARSLQKEEIEAVEQNNSYLVPGLPLTRSIIVDISGGGIRFVGNYAYEQGSLICCKYHLLIDGRNKEYTLIAKVIAVRELDDHRGLFEHRAKYINIDTLDREEIIQFIFEEERKHRKKEKGIE